MLQRLLTTLLVSVAVGCGSSGGGSPSGAEAAAGAGGSNIPDTRPRGGSGGGPVASGSGGAGASATPAGEDAASGFPSTPDANAGAGGTGAGTGTSARPDGGPEVALTPQFDIAKVMASRPETWARLPGFPEGPSFRATDGSVILCAPSLIRIAPDKKRYRMLPFNCLGSVGLADGSLLVAGQVGLYQVTKDGKVALLAEASGANDVSVDRTGNVYFTAGGGVHRVSPAGKHEMLAGGLSANGIEVDPANQYLYISQPGQNQISRFELPADGGPLGRAVAHLTAVPAPDGLTFDARGNLWAALHRERKIGIYDVTARRELGRLDVPVQTTVQNLAFGGPENDALFVVGGNFDANALLLRYAVGVPGFRTNPGAPAYKALRMLPESVNETAF